MVCTQRIEDLQAITQSDKRNTLQTYGAPRNTIKQCFIGAMLVDRDNQFCE